jgi:hypothetical protein
MMIQGCALLIVPVAFSVSGRDGNDGGHYDPEDDGCYG